MLHNAVILVFALVLFNSCNKTATTEADLLIGTWTREGTNGSGPGNALYFSKHNGNYIMRFDCSGSPGPGWPAMANTPYKFTDGKLSYLNYYDSSMGYYTPASFKWVSEGQEFELWLNELLLFMSATYPVKYKKN